MKAYTKEKKQYAICTLDSTSSKKGKGGGGSRVGYMLALSPFVTSLKYILAYPISTTNSEFPGKPCWFCCVNLILQVGGN